MSLQSLYTHTKKNYPQVIPFLLSNKQKELEELRHRYRLERDESEKKRITQDAEEIKREIALLRT